MHPYLPLILLSVFATFGLCFYIGGCAETKQWLPMCVIIPGLFTCFCAYMFMQTSGDTPECEGGWISGDTWMFFTLFFVISMIALPLVFYHCKKISATSLGLHIAGDVCIGIGFGLYVGLPCGGSEWNGY